jgi:nucleoside-diphosphate-sugar epimerase
MKIAVTGGMGKAGQWIVRELTSGDGGKPAHGVSVFDQPRGAAPDHVRFIAGDIRNFHEVFGALAGSDAVIHLAGVPRNGMVSNELTFETNVIGTFNVHEAAWRLGIRRVVTLGSEAVLGWAPHADPRAVAPDYLPIDEDHPLHPQDTYGLSKQASELISRSYTAKADIETVVLRAPRLVSPLDLQRLHQSNGITPNRFGLFHYIDVRDLAMLCRLAVERPLTGCHVLFAGSGESLVAEPLCTLYPKLMPAIGDKAAALTDGRAPVSIERIKALFAWTPRYTWRHGPIESRGQ